MQTRPLGRSPLSIAPLVFGGNVFGWSADEARSFELLDAFVDGGGNLVDTADVYSAWVPGNAGGESETIIGKWLKKSGKRDKVLIATKVAKWAEHPGLSPMNIHAAVEGSLKRLQTDRIDLYFAHEDDASVPMHETLGEFGRLIEQGKVRAIGASNFKADRVADALALAQQHGLPRYECLQPEYNLVARAGYEAELEPLVREEGLGVVCYYALASGFLSGKYRSADDLAKSIARGGAAKRFLNPHGLGVLAALDAVAAAHGATPAQVALAWLVARPSVTAPIASATSVPQLQELLGALQLTLAADEIAALDRASAA
ncbi:aldo/keto reductase [Rhodanobacter sp. DHB23]|uniref:aldo/keto reductase n=1 Tax=Rhodanobacter sp. DHB23 TaxID=2775923 RepID=UPI00177C0CA4|nr:aldo/keto reductase [Rhodanobacter sp. DHB23]MBD8872706.1 aldo/keto reductase [Rhodanobacter sp. DHB23]